LNEKVHEEKTRAYFEPVIGGLKALSISIGGIIGSGIFFILGIATKESGPSVILSLLLAGIIAMLTALSFASLSARIPKEGGEYQFVYKAFGPTIGFFGGLFWIFSTAIAAVTVSLALASYLTTALPFLSMRLVAASACVGFMLIDVIGIRLSSTVNSFLVITKISVLVLFIVVGCSFVKISNFTPFMTHGWGGVLSSAFLIFFAYAGFGKITAAAEEVKNPRKTLPKAILFGVLISSIIYLLVGYVAVGVAGATSLSSAAYQNAPLAYVMLSTGFAPAFFVVVLGAITATSSVLMIQMLGLSRTIYAMSANNQLPAFLSNIHPRFRTPYKAEIILGTFMALGALMLSINSVITLTSLGILGYYSVINLSAIRIRMKEKNGRRRNLLISVMGFLCCILLIFYYFLSVA
jgi:APA family basic amino acid/polyamine antiporter